MKEEIYIVVKAWKGMMEQVLIFKNYDDAKKRFNEFKAGYNTETDEVCIYSWPVHKLSPVAILEDRMN